MTLPVDVHLTEDPMDAIPPDHNVINGATHADPVLADILPLVDEVSKASEGWRETLSVSIGRASVLSQLKEAQIRYFEELGALQPAKTTDQRGSSRLYTLPDLRRLYALSLLGKKGCRPAEAAEIVKQYASQIEHGRHHALTELVAHEGSAITDGFLLARLMSQLIDAAQMELDLRYSGTTTYAETDDPLKNPHEGRRTRIVELILPMRRLFSDDIPSFDAVQSAVEGVRRKPVDMLVALSEQDGTQQSDQGAFASTGCDDRTVLFYSRDPYDLPQRVGCQFCVYIPPQYPHLVMLISVEVSHDLHIDAILHMREQPTRGLLFDRILGLCERIYNAFRGVTLTKNYRYRSDGFRMDHSRESFHLILATIRSVLFPDDQESVTALLIPNRLGEPTALSVLAYDGIVDAVAVQSKISLDGDGQGLSGQAYCLGEPFFALDVTHNTRVTVPLEQACQTALAVPLATSWGIAPFGVFFLGSRRPGQSLTSDVAYIALVLSNILSEMLGRWWLTRLRKEQDKHLHTDMRALVSWLDSLDRRGPDFQRGLAAIAALWEQIHRKERTQLDQSLALVVLDIDRYRQNIQIQSQELFPLRIQAHIREAIERIVPDAPIFWFQHDHVLVLLKDYDKMHALATVRRIASQVRMLPVALQRHKKTTSFISVSAAIKMLTYHELYDLDQIGGPHLYQKIEAIIDHLQAETRRSPTATVTLLDVEEQMLEFQDHLKKY